MSPAQTAQQPTTYKVRVGDAAINVVEWGNGPTAILFHGNPDSGMMWEGIGKRLEARFRCFAPDLPGFGHSEVPTEYEPSLDGMAWFVEQLLLAADIEPPVDLIAHDFGGRFAFAWAVKHSGYVRRIVAINTIFYSLAIITGTFGHGCGALLCSASYRWQ